jgi:hypothetical protein
MGGTSLLTVEGIRTRLGLQAGQRCAHAFLAQNSAAAEAQRRLAASVRSAEDQPKQDKEDKEDRIRPGDRLFIEASNTLPNLPIKGVFRVEASGKVALGSAYGRVAVMGLTPEQAEAVLLRHLGMYLRDPQVLVTRYDALTNGESAGQGQALERRVQQLEEEVRALRAALEKLQKQRRN